MGHAPPDEQCREHDGECEKLHGFVAVAQRNAPAHIPAQHVAEQIKREGPPKHDTQPTETRLPLSRGCPYEQGEGEQSQRQVDHEQHLAEGYAVIEQFGVHT